MIKAIVCLCFLAFIACPVTLAACGTDLFFSEYFDGVGNNKFFEIYNPTSSPIDLTNIKYRRLFNHFCDDISVTDEPFVCSTVNYAESDLHTLLSETEIPAETAWIICNNLYDSVAAPVTCKITTSQFCSFNGDDSMHLVRVVGGVATLIDEIGCIGCGASGDFLLYGATNIDNLHLIRKPSVCEGSPWPTNADAADLTAETCQWTIHDRSDYDTLGVHTVDSAVDPCDGITCDANDQCHDVGTCSAGVCSYPNKADLTPCDDSDPGTSGERCMDGVCEVPAPPECTPGDSEGCPYSGDPATENVGICVAGTRTCNPDSTWAACEDEVVPETEDRSGVCADGLDNDCNGFDDDGPACGCTPVGQSEACYSGAPGTQNIGPCKAGTRTCDSSYEWGSCVGEVTPAAEDRGGLCADFVDGDCNGLLDDGLACDCAVTSTRVCYSGEPLTQDVGICVSGIETCEADQTWGACAGEVLPNPSESCDGLDNDCNGLIDDGITCDCITVGATEACYSGAAGTENNSPCQAGTHTCTSGHTWGPCNGEVTPIAEVCDGVDNNCDGSIDNGITCDCTSGESESCYSGPSGTVNVGVCKAGTRTCTASHTWGACTNEVLPGTSDRGGACADGVDDDCNGLEDDGPACECSPVSDTESCYSGNSADIGRGICQEGTRTCQSGFTWGTCDGEVLPEASDRGGICANGVDEDCNGQIDDGDSCECTVGQSEPCYNGDVATRGIGQCSDGSRDCEATQKWGVCTGDVTPVAETCDTLDNDCDGAVDNGITCDCTPADTQACYSGLASTENVGICKSGTQTCSASHTWGICSGEVLPRASDRGGICANGDDDDCNGQIDDGDPCECTVGQSQACYNGDVATRGIGQCSDGSQDCGTTQKWGVCTGDVTPVAETCDGLDNNCDGSIDNGITCGDCTSGESESCYSGPSGTVNVGVCKAGTRTCTASHTWGACTGEVTPAASDRGGSCANGEDDDCNGQIDDGDPCDLCDGVICRVLDECHIQGDCDLTTGVCSNPQKPDGTECDANDLNKKCWSGTCAVKPSTSPFKKEGFIVGGIVGATVLVGLAGGVFLVYRRKQLAQAEHQLEILSEVQMYQV